jgi:hypothetical protein
MLEGGDVLVKLDTRIVAKEEFFKEVEAMKSTEMQNKKAAGSEGIAYGRLPGVTLLAALAAALANALVYFAAWGLYRRASFSPRRWGSRL